MNLRPPFILAISGGPDSVYLLHRLIEDGHKPILAHLNHGLRGEEGDEDERFVKTLAKEYNLTCVTAKGAVKRYARLNRQSIETAARSLRYLFLEKIRKKYNATVVLTAHHRDDQIETLVMNRLRGAELRGKIGMEFQRGTLVRPLLDISKQEILNYLHTRNLPYRVDPSNTDTRYRRNQIRHELLPELLNENPAFVEQLEREREQALQRYQTLKEWIKRWLGDHPILTQAAYANLTEEKQRFILQHFYEEAHGSTHNLTRAELEEVQKLALNPKTGKEKTFGKRLKLYTEYGTLRFERTDHRTLTNRRPIPPLQINPKLLPNGELLLRHWEPGDRFQPTGMEGGKKLQDFFTDAKIPRSARKKIPIWVTNDDRIVAVGNRVDQRFLLVKKPELH